jgi:hypothetical protein
MPDFVPNEGEAKALQQILNQTLYLGLFQNTPANILSLGEAIVWGNITPATGFVGGNEKAITYAGWTIPTGAQAGNPATYPQQEFIASESGASDVAGYYLRTADNKLLVVGLNPEVELTGVLKQMAPNAKYRVNPQYGAE